MGLLPRPGLFVSNEGGSNGTGDQCAGVSGCDRRAVCNVRLSGWGVMNEPPELKHWILDEEKHPKQVGLIEWATWFEKHTNRVVQQDYVGPLFVSTVFLGIDHNFGGAGPPILFETMVFIGDGGHDELCWRYCSWDDAMTGHQMALKRAREWVNNVPFLDGITSPPR